MIYRPLSSQLKALVLSGGSTSYESSIPTLLLEKQWNVIAKVKTRSSGETWEWKWEWKWKCIKKMSFKMSKE